ncbi:MAG: histidine phosphatase family protein [Prevotella sp.]|nr:histidine phosphatase family protein [Prevotella sp.]
MEQARELGKRLCSEHIDAFVSSDLARAEETLRIILEERRGGGSLSPRPPLQGGSPSSDASTESSSRSSDSPQYSLDSSSHSSDSFLRSSDAIKLSSGTSKLTSVTSQSSSDTSSFYAGETYMKTPLLRERDWGSFTGRFIPDLKDEIWPKDIETLEEMKSRARKFLDLMRETYPGQTVLAVGHGIINKAIQSVYTGKKMNEIEKMMNCEVRELEL